MRIISLVPQAVVPRKRAPYSRAVVMGPRFRGDDRNLEQTQLLATFHRLLEMLGGELRSFLVQPEPFARGLEPPADQPGIRALASLALTPGRVVVLAAAHLAHEFHHMA